MKPAEPEHVTESSKLWCKLDWGTIWGVVFPQKKCNLAKNTQLRSGEYIIFVYGIANTLHHLLCALNILLLEFAIFMNKGCVESVFCMVSDGEAEENAIFLSEG